jgi:hypothetical protein
MCGKQCSNMTYTTKPDSGCQTYRLYEGCYANEACSGTVQVIGAATIVPIGDFPTDMPTETPTMNPTSDQPSSRPSEQPSERPSCQPSQHPGGQPTRQPYGGPSGQPSGQPARQPTGRPSSAPSTYRPSGQPSTHPTDSPTPAPTFGSLTFCPTFAVVNTDSAQVNYAVCGIYACANTTLHMGDCGCGSGKNLASPCFALLFHY